MEKGYIKYYRAIEDNNLLANDNTCFVVFSKLLLHADRKTGVLTTGRFKLAAICNLKPTTLYDALKRLEATAAIRQRTDSKMTSISICNWTKYQQDTDSKPTTNRVLTDTIQEREREKERTHTSSNDAGTDLSKLFDELVEQLGFSKAIFTGARKTKLKARLKTFTPQKMKDAARIVSEDEFLQGENKSGKRFGTIDYLLRNDEKIDEHLSKQEKQLTYKADW